MQTDPKTLERIRELLELKANTEAELDQLISGADKPKRTWSRRPKVEENKNPA